jgi:RNA polymerase sigma factor (sigma-70 family)
VAAVSAEVQGPSDAELIDAVRRGNIAAYGQLYERHVAAAYNLARQLARAQSEADDLVSDAFAKVLDTLRAGRGPDSAFRAYLLTALRHTAYDKTRRDRKIELSDDVGEARGVRAEAMSVPFTDTAVAGLERSLAARAFERLPERWQAVLWHTEIEGQSPADVAPILGLTPNGVSALAYRAREGLKQAYLQVYLADAVEQRCKATTDRLGAWTRQGLSKREKAQVEAHLDECARCRALAAELADVNGAMRGIVAPLILGAGTLGYLAASGATAKAAATTGAAALGAAGAGAGSSGGGSGGAGTSLPRQFAAVGASAVAMAVAVTVGLASGGGQEVPRSAVPAPQPTVATQVPPAPPTQQPPPQSAPPASPNQPPAPPNVPPAPPNESPAPRNQPPAPPDVPSARPDQTPAPAPQPAPANLTASPPAFPVTLVAGGDPAGVPIIVRNTGGTTSGPVGAALNLPAGVTAIPAGPSRFATAPPLSLDGKQSSTVYCPGGTGIVRCGTGSGLRPGESVTLLLRVIASAPSSGGEITGTVGDGGVLSVRVAVRVVVRPPVTVDGVDVRARGSWLNTLLPGLIGKPLLHVTATNTGTSTKPVSVTVNRAGVRLSSSTPMICSSVDQRPSCTTAAAIDPGTSVTLTLRLRAWPGLLHRCDDPTVVVAAALGTARDRKTIRVDCWKLPSLPGLGPGGGR